MHMGNVGSAVFGAGPKAQGTKNQDISTSASNPLIYLFFFYMLSSSSFADDCPCTP